MIELGPHIRELTFADLQSFETRNHRTYPGSAWYCEALVDGRWWEFRKGRIGAVRAVPCDDRMAPSEVVGIRAMLIMPGEDQ